MGFFDPNGLLSAALLDRGKGAAIHEELEEIFWADIYCIACKTKMAEVVPHKAYVCSCQAISTDPITLAQLTQGWRPCLPCGGVGCEECNYLGVMLPQTKDTE